MASVLIVDDEEIIANSIARALGTTDHTVNKFYNGTDALTFFKGQHCRCSHIRPVDE